MDNRIKDSLAFIRILLEGFQVTVDGSLYQLTDMNELIVNADVRNPDTGELEKQWLPATKGGGTQFRTILELADMWAEEAEALSEDESV